MKKPLIGIGSDVGAPTPGARERAFGFLSYVDSITRAGGMPVIIPPQPENAAALIAALDGLVLAGGADCDPAAYGEERHCSVTPMDARRQQNDLALAAAARQHGLPTLGVCLGLQVMVVAAGGKLIQDIDSEIQNPLQHVSEATDRHRHDVIVREGTRLAAIIGAGEFDVNSSHHQSVKVAGEGMRITAEAADGVVEAAEDPQHRFYVGVQWHPEDMVGERSAEKLFVALVEAAQTFAETRELAAPKARAQS